MLRVSGGISDEGFNGSRVRDTEDKTRFTKEGADFLVDAIKKATKPIENISQSNKAAISGVAGKIFENLAKNTEQVQAIVESQGDDTINEFKNLVKMMAAAQTKTGEASVSAIKELIKQIENIKIAAGDRAEELSEALGGFDTAQETLSNQTTVRKETFGDAIFKKATGVDKRTESPWKAFSMEKMFGLDPGTGNILEQAKKEAREDRDTKTKVEGQEEAASAIVPSSEKDSFVGPPSTVTPVEKDSVARPTSPVKPAKPAITNAEGGDITAGIDRESPQNRQVELLEQILVQLKGVEEEGSIAGISGGIMSAVVVGAIVAAMPALLAGLAIGAGIEAIRRILEALTKNDWYEKTGEGQLEILGNGIAAGFGADPASAAAREEYGNRPIIKAKRSGLFDKDLIGNSEVDLNILAATNDTAQLQAILDDNDLSDQNVMLVTKRMEQIERGELAVTPEIVPPDKKELGRFARWVNDITAQSAEITPQAVGGVALDPTSSPAASVAVTPTGDAIRNTTDFFTDQVSKQEPDVTNNITNNYGGGSNNSAPPILVSQDGARSNNPALRGYEKSLY